MPDEESLVERVLRDEESRAIYFGTTQGILLGDHSTPEVQELLQELERSNSAFFFESDEYTIIPLFYPRGESRYYRGSGEIRRALGLVSLSHK